MAPLRRGRGRVVIILRNLRSFIFDTESALIFKLFEIRFTLATPFNYQINENIFIV